MTISVLDLCCSLCLNNTELSLADVASPYEAVDIFDRSDSAFARDLHAGVQQYVASGR
jgi:hypothetical protein